MKRILIPIIAVLLLIICVACRSSETQVNIVATTLPVYDITSRLCANTNLTLSRLITENVSCLHDYTLNPNQMKQAAAADLLVLSGAGFEDFMKDIVDTAKFVVDASVGISLNCETHDHEISHGHEHDPHIWLSPENGKLMAENIAASLCNAYPDFEVEINQNLAALQADFDATISYAQAELSDLTCRELITFHDGFGYMAESFNLTIAQSMEEESGSEASARDLIAICNLVENNDIPAIFIEKNGSDRAAAIVAGETGAKVYAIDTGLSGNSYFDALYHNINTLKEALG